MEDIFQILIFVAFAALSFIPQLVKGKKETSHSPSSPTFFSEEVVEEIPDMDEKKFVYSESVSPIMSESKGRKEECRQVYKKKICLSKKEEAKKAFIYSEIFKRKY